MMWPVAATGSAPALVLLIAWLGTLSLESLKHINFNYVRQSVSKKSFVKIPLHGTSAHIILSEIKINN